jgi:hypothetical protein
LSGRPISKFELEKPLKKVLIFFCFFASLFGTPSFGILNHNCGLLSMESFIDLRSKDKGLRLLNKKWSFMLQLADPEDRIGAKGIKPFFQNHI